MAEEKRFTVRVVKVWERTIYADSKEDARQQGYIEVEDSGISPDRTTITATEHKPLRRRN